MTWSTHTVDRSRPPKTAWPWTPRYVAGAHASANATRSKKTVGQKESFFEPKIGVSAASSAARRTTASATSFSETTFRTSSRPRPPSPGSFVCEPSRRFASLAASFRAAATGSTRNPWTAAAPPPRAASGNVVVVAPTVPPTIAPPTPPSYRAAPRFDVGTFRPRLPTTAP
eukprot:31073-Pelagococcus_subviridis.AAC.8